MSDVAVHIFELSPAIRYFALGAGQHVQMWTRAQSNASAPETDRFEELLVNPTLLTLTRQRGDIDCGGLRYIIVGYGNFDQLVIPLPHGHASLAFELNNDPAAHAGEVLHILTTHATAGSVPAVPGAGSEPASSSGL